MSTISGADSMITLACMIQISIIDGEQIITRVPPNVGVKLALEVQLPDHDGTHTVEYDSYCESKKSSSAYPLEGSPTVRQLSVGLFQANVAVAIPRKVERCGHQTKPRNEHNLFY